MSEEKRFQGDAFWSIQGKKSFVKAKNDWMDFEKIHLSFVQHSGQPKCTQISAIEGTMKIHGADGLLALKWAVDTQKLWTDSKQSRERAAASNSQYPAAVFTSVGGSPANRTKDNKCVFRQLDIAPSSRGDGFVLQMGQCEGVQNSLGGYAAVKGAAWTRINVFLTDGDICDFCNSAYAEYIAYRTTKMIGVNNATNETFRESTTESSAVPQEKSPAPQNTEPVSIVGQEVFMVYDSTGFYNNGYPISVSAENIRKILHDITKDLLRNKAVIHQEDYVSMVNSIDAGAESVSMKICPANSAVEGAVVVQRCVIK